MFNLFKKSNPNVMLAPISGTFKPLEEVEDKVFSTKMMGDGIAIVPDGNKVYSPTDGVCEVMFETGHAIGILASNGARYIIHIGIDTVELKGEGFTPKVKQGAKVKAGDLLVELDLETLKQKRCMDTMLVIENYRDFDMEILNKGTIKAKEELISIVKHD